MRHFEYKKCYLKISRYKQRFLLLNKMQTIDIAAILSPDLKSLLLKDPKASPCKVTITNVPEDLKAMLDAVSRTQVQAKVIPSNTPEVDFKTVDEMVEFLSVAR